MFKLEAYLVKMLRNRFKLEAHVLTNMPSMSNVQTWRPTDYFTEDAVQVEGSNLNYICRSRCWYKMFKLEVYIWIKIVSISSWDIASMFQSIIDGDEVYCSNFVASVIDVSGVAAALQWSRQKLRQIFSQCAFLHFSPYFSSDVLERLKAQAVDSTNFWKKIHKCIAR